MATIVWGITLEQAKTLRSRTVLNHNEARHNSDASLARFRVTSVQTWKTRPAEVRIRVQRGLREFHTFTEEDLPHLRVGSNFAECEDKEQAQA